MAETILKISGMSCAHCVMRVNKALKTIPGVTGVQVDLQKAEAQVSYDESRVGIGKLIGALAEAGYQAHS